MTALAMPSTLRIGLSRGALELKGFVREKEAMVFTFAMPVLLMLIFGTIFKGRVDGTNVDFRQYFAAGIIASGIASTTFISLGVGIAQERDDVACAGAGHRQPQEEGESPAGQYQARQSADPLSV
jgi:ABC-2 type transport system permease protein